MAFSGSEVTREGPETAAPTPNAGESVPGAEAGRRADESQGGESGERRGDEREEEREEEGEEGSESMSGSSPEAVYQDGKWNSLLLLSTFLIQH